ncbi:glycosyltransferase family 4 protein [Lichenicoccus sp.]|uniref:glycosyltransferase family 4 protein n=1 Tax=Lichenicoccus sp. TaxID=2781899 RepID=UPI003D0E36AF
MRFCIITPRVGRNDGQGRVNLEIAAEAARQGHDVVVIAEHVSGLSADVQSKAIVLPPPDWLPTRLLRDQLFAWRSRNAVARDKAGYDAIMANGFVTWARCDVNAVHFVHASWLNSAQHPWQGPLSAHSLYARIYTGLNVALERLAFRRSARLVAVSDSVAGDLRHNRMISAKVSVILNGVDLDEFHPGPAQREALGLPVHVKLALFAGDLKSPRKNLETVLKALTMVPDLHLAVAGREQGTPYPEMARQLGVARQVHFLGFRRDMPSLMRASDLFVFPSRYEACSLVLLEALASGIPVVTARSAGGSELIEPGVGTILNDCEDAEALAAALRIVIVDDHRRQQMGRNARGLAERYSWEAMASKYVIALLDTTAIRDAPAWAWTNFRGPRGS